MTVMANFANILPFIACPFEIHVMVKPLKKRREKLLNLPQKCAYHNAHEVAQKVYFGTGHLMN